MNCDRLKRPCEGYRRGEITFLNEEWKSHGVSSSIGANDSTAEAKCGREDGRGVSQVLLLGEMQRWGQLKE